MYTKIEKCRICGNTNLEPVLDLGTQMLTGVFPRQRGDGVTSGPIRLVKCMGSDACGLLQLAHSYSSAEMYGDNYGYRSGLNASMVAHLHAKVKRILSRVALRPGDLVIDIGSNDSTTLQAYPSKDCRLVGIDPTGSKFRSFYPEHIELIPDFFSAEVVRRHHGDRKARVITSFSMFYDLEDPTGFMRQIHEVLADDGIWIFEQSYMPTMLATNSYDTVCHEHLEFYALKQIEWMARRVGFRILDVEFNDVNGGSFSVTVTKANGSSATEPAVEAILARERQEGLDTLEPYRAFETRVRKAREDLLAFLADARSQGKTVAALGASTKGNVLLQYCNLTERDIAYVGEVNSEKFGCFTPGTWIPIVPEAVVLAKNPDYLVVLPWHFRKFFEGQEKFKDCTLVFPLPKLEIVPAGGTAA